MQFLGEKQLAWLRDRASDFQRSNKIVLLACVSLLVATLFAIGSLPSPDSFAFWNQSLCDQLRSTETANITVKVYKPPSLLGQESDSLKPHVTEKINPQTVENSNELEWDQNSKRKAELRALQSCQVAAQWQNLLSAWEAYKPVHVTALKERRIFLYRIVVLDTGHGNRLPGVVTAFMLALVTNRALLIDYCGCVWAPGGNCPCQWSDFFDQGELELDVVSAMKADPELERVFSEASRKDVHFVDDAWELDLRSVNDSQVLVGSGEMDWTAHLWLANPHHAAAFRPLFLPGHVFNDVARLLMRPTKQLRQMVDTWTDTRFRTLTIGVHVRTVRLTMAGLDLEKFLPYYMHLAKSLQMHQGIPDDQTAIYLASDHPDVRAAWQKYLSNSSVALLTQPEERIFHNGSATEGLNRDGRDGMLVGLLEMFLLAATDDVIGTRASTFSHVAAAFGRHRPWIINRDGYYGSATSDPCFWHIKPNLNAGMLTETAAWLDFTPENVLHLPCAHW